MSFKTNLIAFFGLILALAYVSTCMAAVASDVKGVGFGSQTTGGKGGKVYQVTNLNDNGAGSFRDIVANSPRPAIIQFSVCGAIELKSRLKIEKGDLTVDGGTCGKGPGIQFKNYPVTLYKVKNIILTQLAFREGTDSKAPKGALESSDSLEIGCSQDIVLDHLSLYWGTDENLSFYCYAGDKAQPTDRISVQYSIIAEALRTPKALQPAVHSMGLLIDGAVKDITIYSNLFVSNGDRNPEIGPEGLQETDSGTSHIQLINNLIYNSIYVLQTGGFDFPNWKIEFDVVSNLVKYDVDTFLTGVSQKNMFLLRPKNVHPVTLYAYRNISPARPNEQTPDINIFQYGWSGPGAASVDSATSEANLKLSKKPLTNLRSILIVPVDRVEEFVLNNAGKTKPCRDPIDRRVINNVKKNTPLKLKGQGPVDEPADVGGYMLDKWTCS